MDNPEFHNLFSSNPPGVTGILREKQFFIAGAGGLGSNLAFMLVRAGAGELVFADYDTVSYENLNRQQYFHSQAGMKKTEALRENLLKINPEVILKPCFVKLSDANYEAIVPETPDILFECMDDAVCKADYVRFCLERRPGIPVIGVSGIGGTGPLADIKVKKMGCLYMIGDGSTECDKEGSLSSRVAYAASIQAHTAVRILCGTE